MLKKIRNFAKPNPNVMKNLIITVIMLLAALQHHAAEPGATHTFEAGKGAFMLDGQPFVIKAAELHYPRIPRPYWDHRIKMCKALGMNTICLYVFWNVHEETPGQFDFTGQNDLAEFIRLCHDNGMYVILRPGPYVCAEWEMGGLPWWLLKKEDIRLRESDPYFLERVGKFQQAVADEVGDLTLANGGPIIMIQVENEYGAYGTDKEYVATVRDMLRDNFGNETPMFQCDWSSNFLNNGLDDLIWTLNFGTGADVDGQFAPLRAARPDTPLMCSEFWSGWFDKWGANHETRPADEMIAGITDMLDRNISFSLYMTHGGTNWGRWAGANSPGFAPDVTSYDYDAPITEWGSVTPKYHQLRETLARYPGGDSLPLIPAPLPIIEIAPFALTDVAPLFDNLPAAVTDTLIRPMEFYGQGYGSILYRTHLPPLDSPATLTVTEPHDFARIFIDGKNIGQLDRRNGETTLTLPVTTDSTTLDILVEAMGRINFGRAIKDYKGITDRVTLSETRDGVTSHRDLTDWLVYSLSDSLGFYTAMQFAPADTAANRATVNGQQRQQPGVYRATFTVDRPGDTFLDFSGWGKGLAYVNGHPLGRFWEIGPQQTLYTPGCWLNEGANEIVIFDILGPVNPIIAGLAQPLLDTLRPSSDQTGEKESYDLSEVTPVLTGEFAPDNGWQTVALPTPATGRYLAIEALDAQDGGERAAIAELYLIGENGQRLSREPWRVRYCDSEAAAANHLADKTFDLQESTYWTTADGVPYPHTIVIDLGSPATVTALQYLPRMEADAPASIRRFRLYLTD